MSRKKKSRKNKSRTSKSRTSKSRGSKPHRTQRKQRTLKRATTTLWLDAQGTPSIDPRQTLGLPAGKLKDDEVRAAYRRALIASPPEQDPEGARHAREARDRLLTPDPLLELVSVLQVPTPRQVEAPERPSTRLPVLSRLAGQLVLYAMLEDSASSTSPGHQQGLF